MMQSIPFDIRMEDIRANVVDVDDFNERVVGAYNSGLAERGLPADDQMARSVVPAATGALRDFSYIAPDIPEFIPDKCVGCMECVTQCPDTAILGKVAEPDGYLVLGAAETVVGLTDAFKLVPDKRGLYAPNKNACRPPDSIAPFAPRSLAVIGAR